MNYRAKKALNPSKVARSLVETDDGRLFTFKQQVRQEKVLSSKLGLRERTQERLQARHSLAAIDKFFNKHADVITKQHYLYELPPCNSLAARTSTFQPNWCQGEKKIYTLDSYAYCLFTRKEVKAASEKGIDGGIVFLAFFPFLRLISV